jgi:alpha-mannosidase
VSCPLSVILSLVHGSPRLDLQVIFDNHARDHRLRMIFPSDLNVSVSYASAQFDVVEHAVKVNPVSQAAWVEDAPSTYPQQDWVDLSDGKDGLGVIVRGLPEYEVLDTARREIAITLLRAVGFLGAGYGMQTASVGAGPHIATPEAQIQRRLNFSLSLFPHPGRWNQAEVWRQALVFNNPARSYTTGMERNRKAAKEAAQPSSRCFLSVSGRNVILSSVKKTETGSALLLRLYNPSPDTAEAIIQLPFAPKRLQVTGLDERLPATANDKVSAAIEKKDQVCITLPARKVMTLRIERE